MKQVLIVGLSVATVLAAGACSCSDEVDQAAKQRIFSPEDPPKVVASAAEKLPADKAAEDAKAARRILGMGAAEATERLGPHKYVASLKFEWSGTAGGVELLETRSLVAGPGGVSGDFHALTQNSRDQGLEVMRVAGQVYARSRYGTFRQRLRDRGMAEREREEIFGALRDFDMLYEGRIQLESKGTVTYDGRSAWSYAVSLGPPRDAEAPAVELPQRPEPKGGIDPSTKNRLLFLEKREPVSLTGELLVDAETSVVLKAKLEGKLSVPATEKGQAATVRTALDSSIMAVGNNPGLKAPKDFLPDADKPTGIAVALDRFGIARVPPTDGGTRLLPTFSKASPKGQPSAGTAKPGAEPEPERDEQEPESDGQ